MIYKSQEIFRESQEIFLSLICGNPVVYILHKFKIIIGRIHNDVRKRYDLGETEVLEAMEKFAQYTENAKFITLVFVRLVVLILSYISLQDYLLLKMIKITQTKKNCIFLVCNNRFVSNVYIFVRSFF